MLQPYNSEQFPGLQMVINPENEKSYTSRRALAQFIGKSSTVLDKHEEKLLASGIEVDTLKTDLPSEKGPRLTKLYGEKFIFSLLAKYSPISVPNTTQDTTKLGDIYVIEANNAIKLGYSSNVKNRLKTLQRWPSELELLCHIKGTLKQEQTLHYQLHNTGDYFGSEWYPLYRKQEILELLTKKLN